MTEKETKKAEESADQVLSQEVSKEELDQVAGGRVCIGNAAIIYMKEKPPIKCERSPK